MDNEHIDNYTGNNKLTEAKNTRKYKLDGLDCAQCASNLEHEISKIPGINHIEVNFITKSLEVDAGYEKEVEKTIKKAEPDVKIESLNGSTPERKSGAASRNDAVDPHKKSFIYSVTAHIWISVVLFITAVLAGATVPTDAQLLGIQVKAVRYVLFGIAYFLMGHKVVLSSVRNLIHGKVFDENFLMTIATFGAIAIGEVAEAVGVMLFYTIGEYFQDRALDKSRASITSLLDLRPTTGRRNTPEGVQEVAVEEISVGEEILVYAGEQIPLDGVVIDGSSYVNTAALTGESVPKRIEAGDNVLGGYVNGEGSLTIKVRKPADDSAVARILHMVEAASARKAPTERFITRFARYYTPIVVGLALLVAFVPTFFIPEQTLDVWGYRALILLVISCPCALVISVPLGYFGGIGAAARAGLLVKGAEYLDRLLKIKTVAFDKTGTITKGNFKVTDIVPRNGYSEQELMTWAAAGEVQSGHPVAQAIRDAYAEMREINAINPPVDPEKAQISKYRELKGHGVVCEIDGRRLAVGSDRLMHREEISHQDCQVEGTAIYVAVDGEYIGYITIRDEIKPEAPEAVQQLSGFGVEDTVMLTGDDSSAAAQIARDAGIKRYYSRLMPEDKLSSIKMLEKEGKDNHYVMFVGDGINDAPVLAGSDIGVAMGGIGSDAAVEAADIVIMKDDLRALPRGIQIARGTRKIVLQNIVGALGVKIVVLLLGIAGVATMWTAVFADVGVALLAVANSLRVLRT